MTPEITLLLVNAAISIVTMIINAHQSVKQNHCKSSCCGDECFSYDIEKENEE